MVIFRCCGFSSFLRPSTTLWWSDEAATTTAAKYHHFDNKPWFCKFDLWINFTRGLKITITFTWGTFTLKLVLLHWEHVPIIVIQNRSQRKYIGNSAIKPTPHNGRRKSQIGQLLVSALRQIIVSYPTEQSIRWIIRSPSITKIVCASTTLIFEPLSHQFSYFARERTF